MNTVISAVTFADGSQPDKIDGAKYLHAEFQHERFVVRMAGVSPDSPKVATGMPIQVDWGIEPYAMRVFYGYVLYTKPEVSMHKESEHARHLQIFCVGASQPLGQGGYLTLRKASVSTAMRRVAEEFRFDTYYIGNHPHQWPMLAQSGKSYWEFLCESAQRCGWSFFTYNTRMFFLDRAAVLGDTRAPVRVLSPTAGGGEIVRFTNNVGTATPDGGRLAVRRAAGVNPRNMQVLSATNRANTVKPLFTGKSLTPYFTDGVNVPFESLAEGGSLLKGMEVGNQLSITATLDGLSDPRIRIGRAVALERMETKSDNGLWYVTGVEHEMVDVANAKMRLHLGRDTLSSDGNVTPLPVRSTWPVGRGSRLVNSQWVLA